MKEYLKATKFINSDHSSIKALALKLTESTDSDKEKALKLYFHVRDTFFYDPYKVDLREEAMRASSLLDRKHGYCGEKACLLAALGRAAGIPSRLGFARVKNHIGTSKLEEILQTDEIVFHGFTEFYLDDKWVKCTPAFNKALCNKLGVVPLDFDGENDSIFQEFTSSGEQFMVYTHNYGSFDDIPTQLMFSELRKYYAHFFNSEMTLDLGEAYFIVPQEEMLKTNKT